MEKQAESIFLEACNQVTKELFSFFSHLDIEGFTSMDWHLGSLPIDCIVGISFQRVNDPKCIKTYISGKQILQLEINICYQALLENTSLNPLSIVEIKLEEEKIEKYRNISLTDAKIISIDKSRQENNTKENSALANMVVTYLVLYETKGES